MINIKWEGIIHSGPTYTSGKPHAGTVMNVIIKDIYAKYFRLFNYHSPLILGFDCHGLPTSNKVLKLQEKKFCNVDDIPNFWLKCNHYTKWIIKEQINTFKSFYVLADHYYYQTNSIDYYLFAMNTFLSLWKKNIIAYQRKPIDWCIHCQSVISYSELYTQMINEVSILFGFKIKSHKSFNDSILLVCTTTPFSIFSNQALAINKNIKYITFKYQDNFFISSSYFFYNSPLLQKAFPHIDINNHIVEPILSLDLLQSQYVDLFHPIKYRRILHGEFVLKTLFTGIVHLAPDHGEVDFLLCLKHKIYTLGSLNPHGFFNNNFLCKKGFKNVHIHVENSWKYIIQHLIKHKLFFLKFNFKHDVSFCTRCKNKTYIRAIFNWILYFTNWLKEKILKYVYNDEFKAMYDYKYIKIIPWKNQLYSIIKAWKLWCLSRERYWGTPILSIFCKSCNKMFIDQNIYNIFLKYFKQLDSIEDWFKDTFFFKIIHKHNIVCGYCLKNDFLINKKLTLDVWYDSAITSLFLSKKLNIKLPFMFYIEGIDQYRGWFQVSLIMNMLLDENIPYNTIFSHGYAVDKDGYKLSKSKGNFWSIDNFLKNHSIDLFWITVATSKVVSNVSLDLNSFNKFNTIIKKILHFLWSLVSMIKSKQYASYIKDCVLTFNIKMLHKLDRIILNVYRSFILKLSEALRQFKLHMIIPNYLILIKILINYIKAQWQLIKIDGDKNRIYSFIYLIISLIYTSICILFPIMSKSMLDIYQEFINCLKSYTLNCISTSLSKINYMHLLITNSTLNFNLIPYFLKDYLLWKNFLYKGLPLLTDQIKGIWCFFCTNDLRFNNINEFCTSCSNKNSLSVLKDSILNDLIYEKKYKIINDVILIYKDLIYLWIAYKIKNIITHLNHTYKDITLSYVGDRLTSIISIIKVLCHSINSFSIKKEDKSYKKDRSIWINTLYDEIQIIDIIPSFTSINACIKYLNINRKNTISIVQFIRTFNKKFKSIYESFLKEGKKKNFFDNLYALKLRHLSSNIINDMKNFIDDKNYFIIHIN